MSAERTPYNVDASRITDGAQPLMDPGDVHRVERVIAFARIVLSLSALVILRLDPTEPSQYGDLTERLLFGYSAVGVILLITVLRLRPIPRWLPIVVHTMDVFFAALLTLFSQGPNSPLFVFLLYPLLAAGYRWGFREVIATATTVDLLLAAQVILINSAMPVSMGIVQGQFALNNFVLRATYVVMAGIVVGYLAENEKRRRFEASAISLILAQARLSGQLSETLNLLLVSLLRTFNAKSVMLVVQEKRATAPAFLWSTKPGPNHTFVTGSEELSEERRTDYLFDAPGAAWHAVARLPQRRGRFKIVAVDDLGRPVRSRDSCRAGKFRASA